MNAKTLLKYAALGAAALAAVLGPWRAGLSRAALEPGVLTAQVEERAAQWESKRVPRHARAVDIVISDAETAALEDMLPASSEGLTAWESQALTLADIPAWKKLSSWFRRKFLRRSVSAAEHTNFAKSFADDPDAVAWTHAGFASVSEKEMEREIARAVQKALAAGARVNLVTQGLSAVPALRAAAALGAPSKGAQPPIRKFAAVDMNSPTLHKYSPAEFDKFALPESVGEWAGFWTSSSDPEAATMEIFSADSDGARVACNDVLAVLGVHGETTSADVIWLVKSLVRQDLPMGAAQAYLARETKDKERARFLEEAAKKHREEFERKKAAKTGVNPEDSLSAIKSGWLAKETEEAEKKRKAAEAEQGGDGGGEPQTGQKRTGWENYDEKCGKCCVDAGGTWDANDRRHCCVGADYDYEVPSCRVTWVDKGGRSHDCAYRMGCRRPN